MTGPKVTAGNIGTVRDNAVRTLATLAQLNRDGISAQQHQLTQYQALRDALAPRLAALEADPSAEEAPAATELRGRAQNLDTKIGLCQETIASHRQNLLELGLDDDSAE